MREHAEREAQAQMVDVTGKQATRREARASCLVRMTSASRDKILGKELPKGDALEVARIAGIMGAKKTAELIPLCHPLRLGAIDLIFDPDEKGILVLAAVATTERTGVEMEALTAAALAALTIYDMVKGIERSAEITDLRLLEKSGGRSGEWVRD